MPKGVYAAASAMLTETRALETAARNLAHVQTPGYRREISVRQGFAEILRDQGATAADRDSIQRDRGTGVIEERRVHDFADGVRDPTGNPFDLALSGKGFFMVRTPDGRDLLTRAGHFSPDPQGRLVTPEGFQLIGQGGAVSVPADAEKILIARDGTMSFQSTSAGITTQTPADRIRLSEVADPHSMVAINGQYFDPNGAALNDANGESTVLHQGALERANVEGVQQLVEMIALQRRHDAAQKALSEQSNAGGSLTEILRG